MNTVKKSSAKSTKKSNSTATATPASAAAAPVSVGGLPSTDYALSSPMKELVEGIRRDLFYVARNMDNAFEGVLGGYESNAYSSLTSAFGKLLSLEEEIELRTRREESAERRAVTQ